MGVSCRIHIRKSREGIHRAGEPISGILSYAIDEPTEYQTAVLSLIGTAKCSWSEFDYRTESREYYQASEEFLSKHINILKKRPEQTITLDTGNYEFNFEFVLPDEIPSSFHDGYSDIKYHLKVKFVKPSFFSFTARFEREIAVYGNVNSVTATESRTYEIQKKLFKLFSNVEPVVYLKARIAKSSLTPGENAIVDISVANETDTNVNSVTAGLCSRTTYTGKRLLLSQRSKVVDETMSGCTGIAPGVPAYNTGNFRCIVPTLPHLYSIQNCNIIKKEYFIKVDLNLPFPHIDATCLVPIIIGEGRHGDCSGVVELDDFDIDQELGPSIGDDPPSYWEVMKEDRTQDDYGQTSRKN